MATMTLLALLLCALAAQVRGQNTQEACGGGGRCQGTCYTASSGSQTAQTQLGSCPSSADRPACCSGPFPSWQWTAWSACSGGDYPQQTRNQFCRAANGQEASFWDCPSPTGSYLESQACSPTPTGSYEWSAWSLWTGCGGGSGQAVRTRYCRDLASNTIVPSEQCGGGLAQESRACYAWSSTLYGAWSGCGGGQAQESRTAQCLDIQGQQAPAYLCPAPAPTQTRDCPTTSQFQWTAWGNWSECSETATTSTRTRNCLYLPLSINVLTSYCNGSDSESRVCYSWSETQWSAWTVCSGGDRESSRERLCVDISGNLAPASSLCPSPAPTETQYCPPYNWGEWGPYGSCVAPCGQAGRRYRRKFCEDADGEIRPDDLCPGERPSDSTTCFTDCSNTPQWAGWSTWTGACNYPQCSQNRLRECISYNSSCVGVAQEFRACSEGRCGSVSFGAWGQWSACDSSCRRYRTRPCLSFTACAGLSQEAKACDTCNLVEPEAVCGKFYYESAPRLFNGNAVSGCRWPWMANVRQQTGFASFTSLCSAVLLDQNTLVTSATCIDRIMGNEPNLRIVLNDQEPLTNTDAAERVFTIRRVDREPSYVANTGNPPFTTRNIGVIHLNAQVGYSDQCIQPVCLPDPNMAFNSFDNYVAAFGQTASNGGMSNTLKEGLVTVASGNACTSNRYSGTPPSDLICSNSQGTDSVVMCGRDEGGMLVSQNAYGAWVLRGINVDNACDVTQPNMFVDVRRYVTFLERQMARFA